MTSKVKAKELVERYIGITREYEEGYGYNTNIENAKICALIAVNEIMDNIKPIEIKLSISSFKSMEYFDENLKLIDSNITKNLINEKLYWEEVKLEIEKL